LVSTLVAVDGVKSTWMTTPERQVAVTGAPGIIHCEHDDLGVARAFNAEF